MCLFCFWKKCLVSTFPFPPHAFEFSKVGLHSYTALLGMVINPFHRYQISLAAIICHSSRILSGQPEFSIPPATSISDAKEWTGDDWVYRSSAGVGTMGTMRDDPVTSKTAVKAGARIGWDRGSGWNLLTISTGAGTGRFFVQKPWQFDPLMA